MRRVQMLRLRSGRLSLRLHGRREEIREDLWVERGSRDSGFWFAFCIYDTCLRAYSTTIRLITWDSDLRGRAMAGFSRNIRLDSCHLINPSRVHQQTHTALSHHQHIPGNYDEILFHHQNHERPYIKNGYFSPPPKIQSLEGNL